MQRLKVVQPVYAVEAALDAVGTGAVKRADGGGRGIVAVVAVVAAVLTDLGVHEPGIVTGIRSVVGNDKGGGVEPGTVLAVIAHIHPCVQRIEQARGGNVVNDRRTFERAVIVVVFKAVGEADYIRGTAACELVVADLGRAVEVVAACNGGFAHILAENAAGVCGNAAVAEHSAVGGAVGDNGVINFAGDTACCGFGLDIHGGPAVFDGAVVYLADDTAAVELADHAADNAEVLDNAASDPAEQAEVIALFVGYVQTVDRVAAAVKGAAEHIFQGGNVGNAEIPADGDPAVVIARRRFSCENNVVLKIEGGAGGVVSAVYKVGEKLHLVCA